MKVRTKYIIPVLITLVLLAVAQAVSPKKTDWSLSFSNRDKKPFGSYIIYRMLPELFPGSRINTALRPLFNTLKDNRDSNSVYIIINDKFDPGRGDLNVLMDFVKRGNDVFISASRLGETFSDTLKAGRTLIFPGNFVESNFTNKNLRNPKPYLFRCAGESFYFDGFDTSSAVVLGQGKNGDADFIKLNCGRGNFYLHSLPEAFSNYSILDSLDADYIYKALSYLPTGGKVYWDEYYKKGAESMKGPLQFVLSTEPLRWAYYILLLSVVLYIIFAGRRRQRVIPVIKPPANSTLEFINIVGSLYFQQGNHKNIARKKITYFLDQVRVRYLIKTDEINAETISRISAKSGLALDDVKEIFGYIDFIDQSPKLDKKALHKLNSLIDSFYKRAGIHG
ncbi:MAG: DUF4350 domain-containing protein [Syntrophomonadaceae bacterium]